MVPFQRLIKKKTTILDDVSAIAFFKNTCGLFHSKDQQISDYVETLLFRRKISY